jgi:hypothetical protein
MERFLSCLAVLLLLLAPSTAPAQRPPAVITGQVMILDSMRPAAHALVRIESHDVAAVADSAGRYRLVVPGSRVVDGQRVRITASRPGLVAGERQVALTAGETVVVDWPVKTWSPLEDRPCYGTMTGLPSGTNPRATDPATLDKLCAMTVLWNRRASRAPRAVP